MQTQERTDPRRYAYHDLKDLARKIVVAGIEGEHWTWCVKHRSEVDQLHAFSEDTRYGRCVVSPWNYEHDHNLECAKVALWLGRLPLRIGNCGSFVTTRTTDRGTIELFVVDVDPIGTDTQNDVAELPAA